MVIYVDKKTKAIVTLLLFARKQSDNALLKVNL